MMNLIHVHPEDLFDKERQGTLTADERRHLDMHLSCCAVCRCERTLQADFNDEFSQRQSDGTSLAALVSGALERGLPETEVPADAWRGRRRSRFIPRGGRAMLFAATLVLACGLAAARSDFAHRAWHLVVPEAKAPEAPTPQQPTAAARTKRVGRSGAIRNAGHNTGVGAPGAGATQETSDESSDESTGSPSPAPIPPLGSNSLGAVPPSAAGAALGLGAAAVGSIGAAASGDGPTTSLTGGLAAGSPQGPTGRVRPGSGVSRDGLGVRRGSLRSAGAGSRHANVVSGGADALSTADSDNFARGAADLTADARGARSANGGNALNSDARPADSASGLFERANLARRQGRLGEASQLYGELRSKYPASPEARLALGLVARIELDRGNPATALSNYNAYLATGGSALREEALAGSALALGRLGRTEDERQTWSQLLSSYPHSSYARLANKRLALDNP